MTKAGSCLIAWIALAAACGGASKSSTTPTPPGPDPAAAPMPASDEQPAANAACQQAVDGMFAVTAAKEPPDLRARSAKVFVHRCEADRWSAEITTCMAAVKALEDADRCETLLTPEQRRELADELAVELDAAGVRPEVQSGKPKPAKALPPPAPPPPAPQKARESAKSSSKKDAPAAAPRAAPAPASTGAPGRAADPCEGGE